VIDVSVTTRRIFEKAHAEKYAASWDNSGIGPAGFEKTRREPLLLTDKQRRTISQFSELVPWQRRHAYGAEVEARLSGAVGDAAVFSACINAADGFIGNETLAAHRLVVLNIRGYVRMSPDRVNKTWKSKAVMGTGR
jgi:hypothetical protein